MIDRSRVLSAFDAQVRRGMYADADGGGAEWDGTVARRVRAVGPGGAGGPGWSGVVWSDLSPDNADRVIADQVGFFRGRGERFEWKLYDYDKPPDLPARLRAAGFVPDEAEALMVAETADVVRLTARARLPDEVRLVPVTDAVGVRLMTDVHDRVFGADHARLRESMIAQLAADPAGVAMVIAMAGGEPVCSARAEFPERVEFASLWGGGTLPRCRGRGIYRATVGYRARLAAARGYGYLQVDALPDSRPILERLGFACLATTTPYIWSPG